MSDDQSADLGPPVDWQTVPPVNGFWKPFDAFFGPGTSAREWTVLTTGVAVACIGTLVLWGQTDASELFSTGALIWAFIASFDVFGGIMTLSTNSGKRWYNSPAERGRTARLKFLGLHFVHPAVIAFLVLPTATVALGFEPWAWFVVNVGMLYLFGLIIEVVGLDIQRPVALVAFLAAFVINQIVMPLPLALSFFVPLFFLKLFVCYLPIESPWRTRPPAPALSLEGRG